MDIPVKKIIEEFRQKLTETYGEVEVMQFVYLLFHEWKGWTKAQLHLHTGVMLEGEEGARFLDALRKLEKNTPIQYIIGATDFLEVRLNVHPGVLIPRPETEELAALVIRENLHRHGRDLSLLDIGTGSGCLAIAIKKQIPGMAITAIDLSEIAVRTAKENSEMNGTQVTVLKANILDREAWKDFPSYSIIISNPPYVTKSEKTVMHPNVVDHEPHQALFVPDHDPLIFYSAIGAFACEHLIRPGLLYLEINERFGEEVKNILLSAGFDRAEVLKDIHGKDRFVHAEIVLK
ncbi:MAG: peptide chain release factor N(5)-glutamine methyltransferase [Bacteroidetes bacterium]|nr:peptide chain release factor N(5)-glutamine methyltransferase [Bacteroidota bacterium]